MDRQPQETLEPHSFQSICLARSKTQMKKMMSNGDWEMDASENASDSWMDDGLFSFESPRVLKSGCLRNTFHSKAVHCCQMRSHRIVEQSRMQELIDSGQAEKALWLIDKFPELHFRNLDWSNARVETPISSAHILGGFGPEFLRQFCDFLERSRTRWVTVHVRNTESDDFLEWCGILIQRVGRMRTLRRLSVLDRSCGFSVNLPPTCAEFLRFDHLRRVELDCGDMGLLLPFSRAIRARTRVLDTLELRNLTKHLLPLKDFLRRLDDCVPRNLALHLTAVPSCRTSCFESTRVSLKLEDPTSRTVRMLARNEFWRSRTTIRFSHRNPVREILQQTSKQAFLGLDFEAIRSNYWLPEGIRVRSLLLKLWPPEKFVPLAPMTNLKSLEVQFCLSEPGPSFASEVASRLPNLERLRLNNPEPTFRLGDFLRNCPSLRRLCLWQGTVPSDAFHAISESKVETVVLESNLGDNPTPELIAPLGWSSYLRTLVLIPPNDFLPDLAVSLLSEPLAGLRTLVCQNSPDTDAKFCEFASGRGGFAFSLLGTFVFVYKTPSSNLSHLSLTRLSAWHWDDSWLEREDAQSLVQLCASRMSNPDEADAVLRSLGLDLKTQ